jgi:hypothetical protein
MMHVPTPTPDKPLKIKIFVFFFLPLHFKIRSFMCKHAHAPLAISHPHQ